MCAGGVARGGLSRFGLVLVAIAAGCGQGEPGTASQVASLASVRPPAPTRGLFVDPVATSPVVSSGGLFDIGLRPLDREQPFFGEPSLRGDLRALWISSLSGSTRLNATGLVDALAPAGPLSLSLALLHPRPAGTTLYTLPADAAHPPVVVPRAATPVLPGTPLRAATLPSPRASNLYRFTSPADAQIAVLRFATSGSLLGFALAGAVAPASGRFSDGDFWYASLAAPSGTTGSQAALAWLPAAGDRFLAVFAASLGGGADYAYDLTLSLQPARRVSAVESRPSDTPSTPLATLVLDQAYVAEDGAIDTAGDVDYLRLVAPAALRIYVKATRPGQGLGGATGLPLAVTLFGGDCKAALAPARPVQQEASLAAGASACAAISSPSGYVGPYRLTVATATP